MTDTGSSANIDCPICWLPIPVEELLEGPCGHAYCQSCLEHLLYYPPLTRSADRLITPDSVITVTLNFCPICRERWDLYDIVYSSTRKPVYQSTDFRDSPIAGGRYASKCNLHHGSYHFPPYSQPIEGDDEAAARINNEDLPFYDISKIARRPGHAPRVPMEDVLWHLPSRTLKGILKFPVGDFSYWTVYLTFNEEFQFLQRGVVIKHYRPLSPEQIIRQYPFDGHWIMPFLMPGDDPDKTHTEIHIQGMVYYDFMGDLHWLQVRQKQLKVQNVAASEILFTAKLELDEYCVGDEITLEIVSGPLEGQSVTWKRQTVSTQLPPDEVNTMGGNSGRYMYRIEEMPRPVPTLHVDTLWGNVFCQVNTVGKASYHFNNPDDCYISYQHAETASWTTLDNGKPMPAKAPLRNVSFERNCFKGDILWQEDYNTTKAGISRVEYTMYFDDQFWCVTGGTIKLVPEDSSLENGIRQFGDDFVYVNAGLYDWIVERYQQDGRDPRETWQEDYEKPFAQLVGESSILFNILRRYHKMAAKGKENPVDFNNGQNYE